MYRSKSGEEVELELWCWEAEYTDGTVLKQFEEGTFHSFQEIDQSKLAFFSMVGEKKHTLIFPDGAKLVHFYKRTILNAYTPEEIRFTRYVFGYELKGITVLLVIMPDGSLVVTDDMAKVRLA